MFSQSTGKRVELTKKSIDFEKTREPLTRRTVRHLEKNPTINRPRKATNISTRLKIMKVKPFFLLPLKHLSYQIQSLSRLKESAL